MDQSQLGNLVLFIGLIIFAAHLFTAIFKTTKIPDVLLLIIIGILIGPSFLDILKPQDFGFAGPILSSTALILLLFEGGNNLSFSNLKNSIRDTIPIAVISFFFIFTISSFLIFTFFTQNLLTAVYAGAILGNISPAIVVPFIKILDLSDKTKSLLFLESAITDVLTIILALIFLDSISSSKITILEFFSKLLTSLIIATLLGLGGAILWSIVLEKIRQFPNTMFTTLAFLLILYGLAEKFGYSGPITILVFSILLANAKKIPFKIVRYFGSSELSEFNILEKSFFSEIVFIVKTFFFIYLGLSIQFGNFFIIISSLILTFTIYICRFIVVKFTLPNTITLREAVLISSIIPKGLAAAVLIELPLFNSLIPIETLLLFGIIKELIYCIILFSIIFTATMVYITEKKLFYIQIRKFFKNFY